jgi:hypothetical protein
MRASLAALLLLAAPVLCAQQGDPVPAPPRTIRFVVQVSPEDLTVDQVPIPNAQMSISRVSLRPSTSPVGYTQAPGLPRLPFVTRSVALPPGAKLLAVEAVPLKSQPVEGTAPLVSWAQPLRATQSNEPRTPVYGDGQDPFYPQMSFVPLDPAVLQAPAWPTTLVTTDSPADALGFQLTTLRISPVQWCPSAQQLMLHNEIQVSVTFQGGTLPQPRGGYAESRQFADLRTRVVNPEDVPFVPEPDTPLPDDVWYLVITDNFYWNSDITIGAPVPGGLVAEFQRLADWKTRKGIKAGVVRISDIVRGRYGDFTTGALDLQEVLRNFLKVVSREWNTYWVVLGGDVEVVPVRKVLGSGGATAYPWGFPDASSDQPAEGKSRWHAGTSTRRIHQKGGVEAATEIVNVWTGVAYRRVAGPSVTNPGWAFATSDTYMEESDDHTDFIVLRGLVGDVSAMLPVAALKENLVPTDFYFASLRSALYDQPGLHDWDANDNGLYGQHTASSTLDYVHWFARMYDGVNFFPNVALGRAPVKSGEDARLFVDKVIAYEQYPAATTSPFGRQALFAASDWDDSAPVASVSADSCDHLEPGQLCRPRPHERPTLWRMRFGSVRAPDTDWQLVAVSATELHTVPYDPTIRGDGWRYCTDATCDTTSQAPASPAAGAPMLPVPAEWVEADPNATGLSYFAFDGVGPDQSVREKEHVRWELSLLAPGLDQRTRLYQDVADTPPDPSVTTGPLTRYLVTDYIGWGANVVSLTGHGLPSGCCGLRTDYVDRYTNGNMGGVVFADSCSTNAFDEDRAISEALLTSPVGGFAAYVGNTRYGWIGYGANYEQLFWSGLPFTRHVGDLLNSKIVYAHDAEDLWSIFALNLAGDPEMPVWLGVPGALVVDHPSRVRNGSLFAVGVRAADGTPLPFSRVTIVFADGSMVSGLTDAAGQRAFLARGADGDRLQVTVTRTDYRPYLGEITVEVPPRVERPLVSGTNYVSTPVVPLDPAIDRVFESIADAVAGISTWDRASRRLLTWSPGALNNTLTRFEPGRGYEVRMRAPATLTLQGEPTSAPVAVLPGRNDVGFNSLVPMALGQALASIRGSYAAIYTWDPAVRQFRSYFPGLPELSTLSTLQPGVGYIIMATKPAIWTLPASPPQ